MAESGNNQLVVVVTHGPEDELASVAFTVANGGMTAGLDVAIFLTGSAVDIVRRRATDLTHVQPLEPLHALVDDFVARGGELWACTPCVKARGYEQEDPVAGTTILSFHEVLSGLSACPQGAIALPAGDVALAQRADKHAFARAPCRPTAQWL